MPQSKDQRDFVGKVLEGYYQDKKSHDVFVEKAERCYRSYRAILENRSQAASWTNKQHPGIVFQSIETMAASLLQASPRWRLKALPIMGSVEEIARSREGARANEILLMHQIQVDNYPEKQRLFDLQALITGHTASKQYWNWKSGDVEVQVPYEDPIYNMFGQQVGSRPRLETVTEHRILHDDPTTEVIDVRHFLPQQGATSLSRCDRVTHRCFYSFKQLKEFEKEGYYGAAAGGQPIDDLKETKGIASEYFQREQELFQTQPHKDDIEVLECWIEGGKRVVTIANETVLLSDKPNPFNFGHLEHPFPFVVCSGSPDLFRIGGISEAELIAELQEMLWTLMNQRLDSLQLVNNAIFLIADDAEDPDAFEFAPGERWLVPRPVGETIQSWSPDMRVANVSLEAEQLVRGDIQNVTGGMPFLSGTQSQGIDQKTATGVSIVTSLAQKRLAAKQQQFIWAKGRIGEQWCALNQQFIKSERLVPVIGKDGVEAFESIKPEVIQGRYLFQTEQLDESMMRQERRAEATAKFQVAMSAAGVMAAMKTPLNLKAYMDDLLDAYDIYDKERYYTALPQQPAGPPGPGANGGGPGGPGGVTNPALAAGQQSPSNPFSMSPEVFLQRQGAQGGGPQNAPSGTVNPFG